MRALITGERDWDPVMAATNCQRPMTCAGESSHTGTNSTTVWHEFKHLFAQKPLEKLHNLRSDSSNRHSLTQAYPFIIGQIIDFKRISSRSNAAPYPKCTDHPSQIQADEGFHIRWTATTVAPGSYQMIR
jgi:hypothetical protein